MLITWKYRERDTIIQRLDPRARLIFMLCMLCSIIQFWDLRYLLFFLGLSAVQYFLAKLTWRETRRAWLFIGLLIIFMTVLTFLTGRSGAGTAYFEEHLITRLGPLSLPLVGWQIKLDVTVEKTVFAFSQFTRMLAITSLALVIPYTIDPSLYGVTFRGLGLPDKYAYAMDLAFRFIPTLGRDFSITLDAQRARGYEVEKVKGGIIAQIRRLAPLLIPVTIGAIVGAEDTIDAMDLRAFGVKKRTWLRRLHYKRGDWALIGTSIAIFVLSTIANALGLGRFWIPPFVWRWISLH